MAQDTNERQDERREEYRAPELEEWGSVTDLTQFGWWWGKRGSRPV